MKHVAVGVLCMKNDKFDAVIQKWNKCIDLNHFLPDFD